MANMQESSPVFFSQRRKGAKAQRAQSILCVFIYKKEHFVFSLRPWRLCESK